MSRQAPPATATRPPLERLPRTPSSPLSSATRPSSIHGHVLSRSSTRCVPYLTPLARRNSAYCRSSFMMCSVNHFFRKLNVLIDTG